ncbi:hypothetical protein [Rudaea sp.]|uniref:hypothetical protein n=1 Tax=Rudaea sp. TaxID=2136325 RepID=UPI0039E6CA30
MFMATAICGAMPSFEWNLAMCFLMGASAGGLLPIAFALMAEAIPAAHRGWLLVALGGAAPRRVISLLPSRRHCWNPFSAGARCGCSTCRPARSSCCSTAGFPNRRASSPARAWRTRHARCCSSFPVRTRAAKCALRSNATPTARPVRRRSTRAVCAPCCADASPASTGA